MPIPNVKLMYMYNIKFIFALVVLLSSECDDTEVHGRVAGSLRSEIGPLLPAGSVCFEIAPHSLAISDDFASESAYRAPGCGASVPLVSIARGFPHSSYLYLCYLEAMVGTAIEATEEDAGAAVDGVLVLVFFW